MQEISVYTTAYTAQYQRHKQPNQKMDQRSKETFLQRKIQMAERHMKRYSTSLIIREMQIKTTMRFDFTLVRMAIMKKSGNNKCWQGCGERVASYTVGGNVNWHCQYGEQYGVLYKAKK